jgi:hypothetical protein
MDYRNVRVGDSVTIKNNYRSFNGTITGTFGKYKTWDGSFIEGFKVFSPDYGGFESILDPDSLIFEISDTRENLIRRIIE